GRVYVKAEDADVFVRALLLAHGLPAQDAATVASCLVSADLRGVDTHGICRLPGYLDRVRRGRVNAKPAPAPKRLTPVAPALAARGKSRRAERRGETIPLGYALDAQGKPTTDPKAALGGVVLPIGGYKGSGLSMLMDIFGGVISGAGFAGGVADQYKVYDRP